MSARRIQYVSNLNCPNSESRFGIQNWSPAHIFGKGNKCMKPISLAAYCIVDTDFWRLRPTYYIFVLRNDANNGKNEHRQVDKNKSKGTRQTCRGKHKHGWPYTDKWPTNATYDSINTKHGTAQNILMVIVTIPPHFDLIALRPLWKHAV